MAALAFSLVGKACFQTCPVAIAPPIFNNPIISFLHIVCLAVLASVAATSKPIAAHVLLISIDGMHQSDLEW